MSKTLRKAIMKRSKLQNTCNKKRSFENRKSYRRQHNICSKSFFETLSINEITGKQLSHFSLTNVRPPTTLF